MTFDTWLTFTILEFFLCLTPGPAVLFVTTTAAARGLRAGLIATAGILTSNVMYFVISGTGVAALLLASPVLFNILRWGGGAYLLLLGADMLFRAPAPQAEATAAPGDISILHGFMIQTLNPKAIAFFSALLPQFIDPAVAVLPQMTILTVTSVLVEAGVMAFYIWLVLRFGKQAGARGHLWFRRLGGAFLVLAAIRLALFG
jgi:homoserine/homoserine lactone efflux protein